MKYVSVVLLLIALAWTWSLTISERDFGLEKHMTLEAEMEQLILAEIKTQHPNAANVVFSQLYTEVVRPQEEIRVHYRYRYDEPAEGGDVTEHTQEGFSVLKSGDGGKTWSRDGGELTAPMLRFKNGTQISPSGKDEATPTAPEKPAAPAQEEKTPGAQSEHNGH